MDDLGPKLERYENAQMSDAEELAFFQELVDSGHAWKLQGFYGRRALELLDAGKINHALRPQDTDAVKNLIRSIKEP